MASIGLKRLYIAKYNYDESTDVVTYSDGMRWLKAMNMNISSGNNDVSKLYGDDGVAEIYKNMSEGTVSLGVTEMPFDVYALMFGKEITEVKLTGAGEATGKMLADGGDGDIPYLGLGVIVPKIVNGKKQFMAVVLKKVQFDWPEDSFETMEESIAWQTPSLEGTVMREDGGAKNMREYTIWDSEDYARKYIEQVLNITDREA